MVNTRIVEPGPLRKRKKRKRRFRRLIILGLMVVVLYFLISSIVTNPMVIQSYELLTGKLSKEVEVHRGEVEYYANMHGIDNYVPFLMAIMEVESGGDCADVMQSSESLGLEPNSLNTKDSIVQGTAYFAQLLKIGEICECDINTVVQAYNYGPDFIYYVRDHGGVYSYELAEEYACKLSQGRQVDYFNLISWRENGGWRYDYGNMFYARLVNRFLEKQRG